MKISIFFINIRKNLLISDILEKVLEHFEKSLENLENFGKFRNLIVFEF